MNSKYCTRTVQYSTVHCKYQTQKNNLYAAMVVTFINTFFRPCTLGWHFDLSPFHAFYVAIFPLRVSFIFVLIFLLQWQDLRAVFPVFKNTSKLRNSLLFVWMHARASFLVIPPPQPPSPSPPKKILSPPL